jgi:SAM-dependent methyltransferase
MSAFDETLDLNFPECLRADFPEELPLAVDAVRQVIAAMGEGAHAELARRSPALKDADWPNYLTCSIARMVHVVAALRRAGVRSGRILDYGSYFGNYSLMLRAAGYEVDSADSYQGYAGTFEPAVALLQQAGARVIDFAGVNRDLRGLPESTYDAILFLGVIEHIPHTPRPTLLALNRVLKPGGWLALDTPNHAYLYHRQRLARGESVMANLEAQFTTDVFEGHHREFTAPEVLKMLKWIGHADASLEMFGYSHYGLPTVERRDLSNHWAMLQDPSMREIIMTVSRKPEPGRPGVEIPDDWRAVLRETETYWNGRMPADAAPIDPQLIVAGEMWLRRMDERVRELQADVNQRDVALQEKERYARAEIERRDQNLVEMNARWSEEVGLRDRLLDELRATWEGSWSYRLRRLFRRG